MQGGMELWLKLGFEFESGLDKGGMLWLEVLRGKGYPVDKLGLDYSTRPRMTG